jgi:L-2,4-diaminobutyrate decarboxylase
MPMKPANPFTDGVLASSPSLIPDAPGTGALHYETVMQSVRAAFPSPVKDGTADARFQRLFMDALQAYDALKSDKTFLGRRDAVDYREARRARMAEGMGDANQVVRNAASWLEGMYTWSHPDVHRLHASASGASIVGQFYGALADANLVWDDLSHRVAETEVRAVSIVAGLVGYDPAQATGVFTFGGTGTTLYGIKLGLEHAQPGAFAHGVKQPMRVLASDVAHYASISAAAWSGLGTDAAVAVASGEDNAVDLDALEAALRAIIGRGERIATIVVTMGTTDSFGIDDIAGVYALRARLVEEFGLDYTPHIHADAVIGWSYCVFNDYDFIANPLGIPATASLSLQRIRSRMQHLALADSIGIDFHKGGYTPYMSSMFLVKDGGRMSLIRRDKTAMPYLFQFGEYDPGVYTLECSRSGGPVLSALANLELLGKEGFRSILSHSVDMANRIKRRAAAVPWLAVTNDGNDGAIAVLRVYPGDIDAAASYEQEVRDPKAGDRLAAVNAFNKKVYDETRRMAETGGSPVFVETSRYRKTLYGESVVGIKCFTLSVFTDLQSIDNVFNALQTARERVMTGLP